MSGVINTTGAKSGAIGTISAPAVGTGTDGYVFTATGAGVDPAWEALSTGKVLQCVVANGIAADWYTQSTSSYVAVTSAAITITPSSASSRILLMYLITTHISADANTRRGDLKIFETNSSRDLGIIFGTRNNKEDAGGVYFDKSTTVFMVDHPDTTSSRTYQIYARSQDGGSFYAHRIFTDDSSNPKMRMAALEISGMSSHHSSA